jgi:hypothetical protein
MQDKNLAEAELRNLDLHFPSRFISVNRPVLTSGGLFPGRTIFWRVASPGERLGGLPMPRFPSSADDPPHTQDIERTLNLADQLRKKGVVIYPVACKNYDDPCEFVMRSSALLSGGQFLFLTDDSGVGGKHDEPHIP